MPVVTDVPRQEWDESHHYGGQASDQANGLSGRHRLLPGQIPKKTLEEVSQVSSHKKQNSTSLTARHDGGNPDPPSQVLQSHIGVALRDCQT